MARTGEKHVSWADEVAETASEREEGAEQAVGGGRCASYAGDDDELVKVMTPLIVRVDFIPSASAAPTPKNLQLNQQLWRELHKLQSNMSFRKEQVKAVLEKIFDTRRDEWETSGATRETWVAKMEPRLRDCCSKIGHTWRNRPETRWLQTLLVSTAATTEPEGPAATTDASASCADNVASATAIVATATPSVATSFYYGFDRNVAKAWRLPIDNKDGQNSSAAPEYAVTYERGDHPDDPMIAVFADHSKANIAAISTKEHELIMEAQRSACKAKLPEWKCLDGGLLKLSVQKRSKRKAMCICYSQTCKASDQRQVDQILFDDADTDEHKAAIETWAQDACKRFAEGHLDATSLKAERKARFQDAKVVADVEAKSKKNRSAKKMKVGVTETPTASQSAPSASLSACLGDDSDASEGNGTAGLSELLTRRDGHESDWSDCEMYKTFREDIDEY